ncbi:hypothetical protein TH53_00505 [Pedobacter lusitanus]|uniref:Uncharacterized protein n=1 Tax=Pedobacter lusitanus TaxID=1503925 RepID=A0A0D0G2J5_9SPHI|nr:hypothetical protein TH53_00505 [Pedobacter lusitanus]
MGISHYGQQKVDWVRLRPLIKDALLANVGCITNLLVNGGHLKNLRRITIRMLYAIMTLINFLRTQLSDLHLRVLQPEKSRL